MSSLILNTRKKLFICCIFILFSPLPLLAQFGFEEEKIPKNVVTWKLYSEPKTPRPGEHFRAILHVKLHPGWHIYSIVPADDKFAPIPTAVKMKTGQLEQIGPVYESNPITALDPVIGTTLSFHEREAHFFQNLRVPESIPANTTIQLSGTIRYQVCSDKICLPPKTENFNLSATIGTGTIRADFNYPQYAVNPIRGSGSGLQSVLSDGFWGFIGVAAIAGLLALLTPCVFPMIPITVSFFTKQTHASYFETLKLTTWFGLGIVITYTVTGIALSSLLGAAGAVQLATNGWVNIAIGALFTLFAFSLMGFINLELPASFGNRVDLLSKKIGGVAGVLLMGLAFTLTSFTCTVQFVGTMLIAASQGHWLWPIIGMIVFSTVFAFPFFLLGFFPRLIHSMRSQSGAWLEHTKIILGLLELAAAFKFFSNTDLVWQWGIITRDFVLSSWIILSALGAAFLLGMVTIHATRVNKTGAVGFTVAFSLLLLSIYLSKGLNNQPLNIWIDTYLPPDIESVQTRQTTTALDTNQVSEDELHNLPWMDNLSAAIQLAQEQDKRIFVDFTGYTCINCRWMEKNIFVDKRVLEKFREDFILVQLFTDGGDNYEKNQALQIERFKTIALPFYVVLDNTDNVLARHAGIISTPEEFLKFLNVER